MEKYKMYEVEIAYCSDYHIDTFKIKASNEKHAIDKAKKKRFRYGYLETLFEKVREIRKKEYE